MTGITKDTVIDGRYKVVRRLGTGGMADVFLCEDQQLGRKVALKLLHRRFAEDPAFVERFRREARSAAGLQHQNIVGVYDRGEYDGTYYIAMEYLPGRTLKAVITEEAPLDPVRAIDIAIQILKAARFAHRRGIVHRDLKPHNVIVDDAGDAKVTDFGIARAGASDMTETGSIMGTAQYLSPEQAQGHSVTQSSDLYSVGVVLYEMLTGRVPFDGEQAVTIALKHVSEAPIPPSQINPNIPPELEQTILWTLNKNASDRPVDADQLITVLQHCRDAILAGAAGERTASMAAIAAGAAAGMPIDPANPLPLLPPPVSQPVTSASGSMPAVVVTNGLPPEEERGGGWRPWLWALLVLLLVAGAATGAYFLSRPKQVLVPSVTGDPLNLAVSQLHQAGFKDNPYRVASGRVAGTVLGQTPNGHTKADKGSTVTLKVSKGRGNVRIPSVQGESKATAEKTLKGYGLKVTRTQSVASSRWSSGEAAGTNPGAGQSVPSGQKITLLISSGPAKKQIPNVKGQNASAASATLHGDGFHVKIVRVVDGSVTAGQVLNQTPGGGVSAAPNSTVTITVAKAPARGTVPTVTGDPTAEAISALQAAGFNNYREQFRIVRIADKAGTVVAQRPAGTSKQPKSTTVVIVIGRFHGSSTTTTTSSSSSTTTTTTTPTTSTTPTNSGLSGTVTQ
jgi:beta-lactam-binding protein with PASTA domain/predicted Ser/Thr protein kinase